jgi:hypothetical protein
MNRSIGTVAAVGALLALTGCTLKKPPPARAAAKATEPPPPPKPQTCDDLARGCVAKGGLRAKIGAAPWTVQPPDDWTYAQEPTLAIAVAKTAGFAVTTQEVEGKKHETTARDEAFARVTEKLAVKLAAKKINWPHKPHKTSTVGTLKLSLYQLESAVRDGKKGPLLVFTSKLGDGHLLVGAGFVPDDDETNADTAILKCIDSIAPEDANEESGGTR